MSIAKQTRLMSLIETAANIAVGFAIQVVASYYVLPWFGFRASVGDVLGIGAIMTVISILRQFLLRRFYEARRVHKAPPEFIHIIEEIAAERLRQIHGEKYTLDHDDQLADGELADMAACYAVSGGIVDRQARKRLLSVGKKKNKPVPANLIEEIWPGDIHHFKPSNARRDLIKSAALAIAEIGRLERLFKKSKI